MGSIRADQPLAEALRGNGGFSWRRANRHHAWVTDRLVDKLLDGITSRDIAVRQRSADEVTGVHRSLSPLDVELLSHFLVATRLVEPDEDCQKSQLRALSELARGHDLPAEAVLRLALLPPTTDPSQIEYLDSLLGN